MEVGDSRLCPTMTEVGTMRTFLRRRDRSIQVEKQADGSGWRVWRIS